MICPYCGKDNANQATFCTNCGAPLQGQQTQSPQGQQTQWPQAQQPYPNAQPAAPKKKKTLIVVLCCVAVVAVVAAVVLILLLGGDSYEDRAEDFVQAVVADDLDEAETYLHPDTADLMLDRLEDFASNVSRRNADFTRTDAEQLKSAERKEYQENLQEYYDISPKDVGDFYEVRFEDDDLTLHIIMGEIEEEWYVVDFLLTQ